MTWTNSDIGEIKMRLRLQALSMCLVHLNSPNDKSQLHLKQAALIALCTSLLVLGSPARAHEEGEQADWGGNVIEQSFISSKYLT